MPYSEENGQVVLRMSREDYESLLMRLGTAFTFYAAKPGGRDRELALLNRLNEGNPNYTPYKVEGV